MKSRPSLASNEASHTAGTLTTLLLATDGRGFTRIFAQLFCGNAIRWEAHAFLDRLPPDRLTAVRGLLETMLDPAERELALERNGGVSMETCWRISPPECAPGNGK